MAGRHRGVVRCAAMMLRQINRQLCGGVAELGKDLFDRVQVRRVGRSLAGSPTFIANQIVHARRHEELLGIGRMPHPAYWTIRHVSGIDMVMEQRDKQNRGALFHQTRSDHLKQSRYLAATADRCDCPCHLLRQIIRIRPAQTYRPPSRPRYGIKNSDLWGC